MASRYLIHFVHEHIPFRWAEFLSVTKRSNCKFRLISSPDHIRTWPYIIVKLDDGSTVGQLVDAAKRSYLVKELYELWAESSVSLDHLSQEAERSHQNVSRSYAGADQTFRINCESFGTKLSQPTKVEWIKKMVFMESYDARPDLKFPKQTYCILEMNERTNLCEPFKKQYFFGREIARGDRCTIQYLNLKERIFIANTSMDPMLSLIAANLALVKKNDIVYDPFVGSGSILVAAAYQGAYVFGSDIDWKLLHGKSRSSRKGQQHRDPNESVKSNLKQYNLESRYLDVMVSDVARSPLCRDFVIDSIITDPPYGVRECSEKVGSKREVKPREHWKVRYPAKITYSMSELLTDLLNLAVRHLPIGGRLIYFLPVTTSRIEAENFTPCIPQHPCLQTISYCKQTLASKVSRLLVVMEKTRPMQSGDEVHIPQLLLDMNFRETYFGKEDLC